MKTKRRIFYDKITGKILCHIPEREQSEDLPIINELAYKDFEIGYKTDEFQKAKNMHIDVTTDDIIFDEFIPDMVTPQEQIAELQQQLLQAQGVV